MRCDLAVIGGGPTGLATAINARMSGMSVVVIEPRRTPIDKACGEGIMPGGVAELDRLGVAPAGHPLRGITYRAPGHLARAPLRSGPGLGVRRTELHTRLHQRAISLGAELIRGTAGEVRPTTQDVSVQVDNPGQVVRASFVVAADGLHSPTRRRLGLEQPAQPGIWWPRRFGLRRHYRLTARSDDVEVHWGPSAEAYVTPVADDLVGVALLTTARGAFDRQLAQFHRLRQWVDTGEPVGRDRGAGPLRRHARRRVHGRVLLAGDAAGYVDAVTGEGISLGLAQARLAVAAVSDGCQQRYERDWRSLTRAPFLLTGGLVALTRWSPARRGIVPLASTAPAVFERIVRRLAYPSS